MGVHKEFLGTLLLMKTYEVNSINPLVVERHLLSNLKEKKHERDTEFGKHTCDRKCMAQREEPRFSFSLHIISLFELLFLSFLSIVLVVCFIQRLDIYRNKN